MSNTPKSLWAAVLAICLVAGGLVIFGCSRDAPHDTPVSGKLRIVSLAPSVTEILFALALGDSLVGATDHCDYPPEAEHIERVGGFGAPNVEKLLALSPDLVIAAGLEREEIAEVLRRSGIRVLDVRIRNFDELFDAIRQIGKAVDRFAAGRRRRCTDAGRTRSCRGTERHDASAATPKGLRGDWRSSLDDSGRHLVSGRPDRTGRRCQCGTRNFPGVHKHQSRESD